MGFSFFSRLSVYYTRMILGSHLSVAGGLYKALEAADRYGFPAVALFVRSPRQWSAPPLTEEAIRTFRETRKRLGTQVIVAHASYLINLAGEKSQRKKGRAAVSEDLRRCAALGIEYLVLHPGSYADADTGIERIAEEATRAMAAVPRKRVKLLFETTAGQGNCIGHRFEHLAEILRRVRPQSRFGVCLDTAHIFAAGYEIRTRQAWRKTIKAFDDQVGLKRLYAIHCNDSLKAFASRVDRHAHIGEGEIGSDAFSYLVNDKRFSTIPLIMETPKGIRKSDGRDWDDINSETLYGLCTSRRGKKGA